ncbi:MAG TPA: thermonuclease family protein [Pyrinomonadaceae bacterium]
MKITRLLLISCAFILVATAAVAATLHVKVTEVQSGNTLVASNMSRALKVRLKGIAPPEAGQPFSDVAREHLKMLVLDKAVVLDYTHLSDGYFEAKISLNGIDVGSQMLRDGAAWYDPNKAHGLTDADRELYANCEKAARDEKRGLWSDAAAVAPWEFLQAKKTEAAKQEETARKSKRLNFSAHQEKEARKAAANRVLSNKHFGRGDVQPGDIAGNPTIRLLNPNATPGDWIPYRSESPKFSIRVPWNSYAFEFPLLNDELKIVNLNYVVGIDDGAIYTLTWLKGSSLVHAPDKTVADAVMDEWVKGINHYFQSEKLPYTATYSSPRNIRMGTYSGKQYSISADAFMAGYARIFSRRVGDQHEVFALAVFSRTGDESAFDFLNSLKFLEPQK